MGSYDSKNFYFEITSRVPKSAIKHWWVEEELFPVLVAGEGYEIAPVLYFACSDPTIPTSDVDETVNGWFANLLEYVACNITESETHLVIHRSFRFGFDPDTAISLAGNRLTYTQQDYDDSIRVYPFDVSACMRLRMTGLLTDKFEFDAEHSLHSTEKLETNSW